MTKLNTCDHQMICLNDPGHWDEFSTWSLKGMFNLVSERNFEVVIESNFQLGHWLTQREYSWGGHWEELWGGHREEFSNWPFRVIFNLVTERNFEERSFIQIFRLVSEEFWDGHWEEYSIWVSERNHQLGLWEEFWAGHREEFSTWTLHRGNCWGGHREQFPTWSFRVIFSLSLRQVFTERPLISDHLKCLSVTMFHWPTKNSSHEPSWKFLSLTDYKFLSVPKWKFLSMTTSKFLIKGKLKNPLSD